LIGRLSGPRHGNGHYSDGGWACFHLLGFGPGRRSRKTTSGYCQYSMLLTLCNSSKQQLSTWMTRLLAPYVCALVDGPFAPVVKRRSTPRSGRRSCPGAVQLRLLLPPASPCLRWTRCCIKLQQGEPSWLQRQQRGGGDLVGGRQVVAGSCGTAPCVPAESSSVKQRCKSGYLQQKEVEYLLG
jgi:hypothetical protein